MKKSQNVLNKEVTSNQLQKAMAMVYMYRITIRIPSTRGELSKKFSMLDNLASKGQLPLRNVKHGYGKILCNEEGRPYIAQYTDKKFVEPCPF